MDFLALTTCAFVLTFGAITALCLGGEVIRRMMFPVIFLALMIPMPSVVNAGVETVLQHGSASVAYALFSLAGTPLFRQDLIFQLPGITLEVAPECSGLRSTLALFITSLVAGYMFLDSRWKRVALAAIVLPLALLRNGFRVFTIGELCVHVSPDMIHSYIHHKGGPIFFVLSLIPFSLVLLALIKSERRGRKREAATVGA